MHLVQKDLSTIFIKQPVKHWANLSTKTQEAQRHVQVIESYINLPPPQMAGQKLWVIGPNSTRNTFSWHPQVDFSPVSVPWLTSDNISLTISLMEVLLVFQRLVLLFEKPAPESCLWSCDYKDKEWDVPVCQEGLKTSAFCFLWLSTIIGAWKITVIR